MVSSSVGRMTPWFQDVFGFFGDLFEAANQTLLETQIVDTFIANAAKKALAMLGGKSAESNSPEVCEQPQRQDQC